MPNRTINLVDLADAFAAIEDVAPATAGIGVADPQVARYARALEYGSVAGEQPWPHPGPGTTRAVNPETGEEVVVSLQAPNGFVRTQAAAIAAALVAHLAETANWLEPRAAQQHIEESVNEAARRGLELVRTSAPRDSGKLIESLQITDAV